MDEFTLDLKIAAQMPRRKSWRIGTIGAGAIVRGCHLVAYRNAGFNSYGIASLDRAKAAEVAKEFDVPNVYDSWQKLIKDTNIEVIDIAVPPDKQLDIVREAVKENDHIKG